MMGESICIKLLVAGAIGVLCSILPIISGASLTLPLDPEHICVEKDCQIERLEKAAEILKYRDETADPCENFFKYACGNWKQIPYSQQMLRAVLEATVNDMIAETTGEESSKAYKLIHDFYSTCMDDDARGEKPLELLKGMIMDVWPPTAGEKWNEADFDWIDWMGKAKRAGFTTTPFPDWEPASKMDDEHNLNHELHMPTHLFPFMADAKDDDYNHLYSDYMIVSARLLGATDENSEKELTPVYEFEKKLYAATWTPNPGEMKDMTIDDMQKEFPGIDWAKFVEKTLTPFVDPGHTPKLNVENPAALKKFITLINETPKRVLASYAFWKEFAYAMPYLTEEFKETRRIFMEKFDVTEVSRKDFCEEMTKTFVQFGIEDLIMDHFEISKKLIGRIFDVLKLKIKEMIQESKVLTEDEKKKAVDVMTEMNYTIGNSEKYNDKNELDAFYADATITKDNFLQTLLNMNAFVMKKENSKKVFEETVDHTSPAIYGFKWPKNHENHLYIPKDMIFGPAFDENLPLYVNFGAAGSHMAREMFKSLVDVEKALTEQGATPNGQMKCFMDLGQNITNPIVKEAFAEEGVKDFILQFNGFRAAYSAYKQFTGEIGPELGLPDLPYTTDQLFWLSFANSMCYLRPEVEEALYPMKDLNAGDFAIMSVMKNIPEVAAAFECHVGSNMNPAEKCSWW